MAIMTHPHEGPEFRHPAACTWSTADTLWKSYFLTERQHKRSDFTCAALPRGGPLDALVHLNVCLLLSDFLPTKSTSRTNLATASDARIDEIQTMMAQMAYTPRGSASKYVGIKVILCKQDIRHLRHLVHRSYIWLGMLSSKLDNGRCMRH